MIILFDYLYTIALSVVGGNKHLAGDHVVKRAHRAVIIMSYMIGLTLSSIIIYAISLVISLANLSTIVFVLAFLIGLFTPYIIINFFYIKRKRFALVYPNTNIDGDKAIFAIAYIICHVGFLVIGYFAGRN